MSCRRRSTRSWPKTRSPPADSLASVRLFARLFRLIWGAEVDAPLRPLLAVSFVGTMCFSAGWSFVGIWAIKELGASSKQLGAAYLIAAVAGFAAGYLGGHASDYLGRRPLILLGWGILSATFLAYTFVGQNVVLGLGLGSMLGIGGSIGGGADLAMVADLVPRERHEAGYASVRVANNLGVVFGPVIGGLLLIGRNWTVFFVGVTVLSLVAIAIGYRFLPRAGAYAPTAPPTRRSSAVIRRDHAFLALPRLGRAGLPRVRRVRDGRPRRGGRLVRALAGCLGLPRDHQSGDGHPVPAPRHALELGLAGRTQARDGDAPDGRLAAAAADRQLGRDAGPRALRLRRRRDALGADLAGDRRRAWRPRTCAARTWARSGAWARSGSRSARSPGSSSAARTATTRPGSSSPRSR